MSRFLLRQCSSIASLQSTHGTARESSTSPPVSAVPAPSAATGPLPPCTKLGAPTRIGVVTLPLHAQPPQDTVGAAVQRAVNAALIAASSASAVFSMVSTAASNAGVVSGFAFTMVSTRRARSRGRTCTTSGNAATAAIATLGAPVPPVFVSPAPVVSSAPTGTTAEERPYRSTRVMLPGKRGSMDTTPSVPPSTGRTAPRRKHSRARLATRVSNPSSTSKAKTQKISAGVGRLSRRCRRAETRYGSTSDLFAISASTQSSCHR